MGRGRKGEIQGKRIVKIVGSEFKEQENLTQHLKVAQQKAWFSHIARRKMMCHQK